VEKKWKSLIYRLALKMNKSKSNQKSIVWWQGEESEKVKMAEDSAATKNFPPTIHQ
jgi:hypothetical protein